MESKKDGQIGKNRYEQIFVTTQNIRNTVNGVRNLNKSGGKKIGSNRAMHTNNAKRTAGEDRTARRVREIKKMNQTRRGTIKLSSFSENN